MEVQSQLTALSSAEVSLSQLNDLLETAARDLEPEVAACRGRLETERGALEAARARLESALVGDAEVWEKAKQAAPAEHGA